MNRSERFVHDLARNAFMSLWTYPNPVGKNESKELCDVLVVCRPDIIIFSVKDIQLKTEGDPKNQIERWRRRAIEDSVIQIKGAERRLQATEHVIAAGGNKGVDLGPLAERAVHRVAIAIGSSGAVPLESKDFGSGFVHVFDEQMLWLLLQELDTVDDFVTYLRAREALLNGGLTGALVGSEEDLLASYLVGIHSFEPLTQGGYGLRVIAGSWDDLTEARVQGKDRG